MSSRQPVGVMLSAVFMSQPALNRAVMHAPSNGDWVDISWEVCAG